MSSPPTGAQRETTRWFAAGASVVLTALSAALVAAAWSDAKRHDMRLQSAQAASLDEARRALESAAEEIVVVRMLDAATYPGDRSDRLALAGTRFSEAADAIRDLAAGDGHVATEASVLLEDLPTEVLADSLTADIAAVFTIAEDTARWSGNDEQIDSERAAIQQLSYVTSLPLHVMIEGIAAEVSIGDRTVEPSMADFFAKVTSVVRNDGGWYGTDPTAPLVGSEWIDITEAREILPDESQLVSDLTAASSLIEYDAWMRDLGQSDTAPPFDVLTALEEADRLTDELSAVIDELVASESADDMNATSAPPSRSPFLLGLAASAALLAAVSGVVAVRMTVRARRSANDRARLALRDALTGVGSRHELEQRTRALTMSPRFEHHLVAMVDLDRFKMVNDAYGHAAGDAILIEVATRLQQVTANLVASRPDIESTVIRLGGDEFLLTAHGARPFDIAAIVNELDAIRNDALLYQNDRIGLAFSVGMCHRAGQHQLDDLMAEADLAAYNDKAARAKARNTFAPPQTPRQPAPHGPRSMVTS